MEWYTNPVNTAILISFGCSIYRFFINVIFSRLLFHTVTPPRRGPAASHRLADRRRLRCQTRTNFLSKYIPDIGTFVTNIDKIMMTLNDSDSSGIVLLILGILITLTIYVGCINSVFCPSKNFNYLHVSASSLDYYYYLYYHII